LKEINKSRQLSPAAATLLKIENYPQIWVNIELRKANLKLKLDTINDRHIIVYKNYKTKNIYHYILLF
jgi:hypothetical protein